MAVMLFSSNLIANPRSVWAATQAPSAVTVIRPSSLAKPDLSDVLTKKWFQVTETAGASGAFVNGPGTPPAGNGSYSLKAGLTGGEQLIGTVGYLNTRLANITRLTYQTWVSPTSLNVDPITLNIGVDFDSTDANLASQGRLIFVPSFGGTLIQNVWQTWDALAGKWYATGAPGNASCTFAVPCSWPALLALFPNAVVHSSAAYGLVGLKLGENAHPADTFADALTIGISNVEITYDFEPELPCSLTCYVDAVNGNDAQGGDTIGTAKRTIQAAIDAVQANGTVRVLPGTYNETASNRTLFNGNGPYQFGVFISNAKSGITVQGVSAADVPVASYTGALAVINTNATNSFGPSGVFVEGSNVTLSGLRIGPNTPAHNKTLEVIGDNFTLRNSHLADPQGSLTINDYRFSSSTNTSFIKSYHIEDNYFPDGLSLDIANGAGFTGPITGRTLLRNSFVNRASDTRTMINFTGSGSGVAGFTYSVGGALIQGNTFTNTAPTGVHIRARATYDNAQFDWNSYWKDNTFNKGAIVGLNPPVDIRPFMLNISAGTFNTTRQIGVAIQPEINHAADGDTVVVGPGDYTENLTIAISLTLNGPQADVVAKGRTGREAVIHASTTGTPVPVEIRKDNVTVNGFKFVPDGNKPNWYVSASNESNGDGRFANLKLLNNTFVGNTPAGSQVNPGGLFLLNGDNALIQGNFFDQLGAHAVFMSNNSNNTVYRNNYSYRNVAAGFSMHAGPHKNVLIENNQIDSDSAILFAMRGAIIRNNVITSSVNGSGRIYLGGGDEDVLVSDNTWTSARSQAIVVLDDGSNNYGSDKNITITQNRISTPPNLFPDGASIIDIRDVAAGTWISGNQVTVQPGSLAPGTNAFSAIGVRGNVGAVVVRNNALNGNNVDTDFGQTSAGILVRPLGAASTVLASGNVISGFHIGIDVQGQNAAVVLGSHLNRNNLAGNSLRGAASANATALDAACNWWGAVTGPTVANSANMLVSPWLISSTLTSACNQPTISISDGSVLEGNSGTRAMGFTATLSLPSPNPVSVDYATQNGTALAGADFVAANGKITFSPGVTQQVIGINAIGDILFEPDETFGVVLTNAVNAVVIGDSRALAPDGGNGPTIETAGASGTGIIRNDDDAPVTGLSIVTSAPTPLTYPTYFTATQVAGDNATYTWNFGDGATASGRFATHIYTAQGFFSVVVTATNQQGSSATSILVQIVSELPKALAGPDQTVLAGDVVTLDGSASNDPKGQPIKYGWAQVGGPAVAIGRSDQPKLSFAVPSLTCASVVQQPEQLAQACTLVLQLTVTDSLGLNNIDTVNVLVQDRPLAGLVASGDSAVLAGSPAHFLASVSQGSGVVLDWDFGDGTTSGGANPDHIFNVPGTYLVTVNAHNSQNSLLKQLSVVVANAPPMTDAGDDQFVLMGSRVTLDGSRSADPNGDLPIRYQWTQVGGALVALDNPVAAMPVFTAPTTASVLVFQLQVQDARGLGSGNVDTVQVNVNDGSIINVQANSDLVAVTHIGVHFTATVAAGSNLSYTWDFGDGKSGNGKTVTHVYANPSNYTVRLTVSNSKGNATTTLLLAVSNPPPVANAGADRYMLANGPGMLDGSASSDPNGELPLTYAWAQTGGTPVLLSSATISQPVFSAPDSPDVLIFDLRVRDSAGAASVVDRVILTVTQSALDGLVAQVGRPAWINDAIPFTASAASREGVGFVWDFGDGAVGAGAITTHRYSAVGSYIATVTATTATATASANVQVEVTNAAPVARIVPSAVIGSAGQRISLDASSSSDPNRNVPLAFNWVQVSGPLVFLNGSTSSAPNFIAPSAVTTTTLTFRLVVFDALGAASAPVSTTITAYPSVVSSTSPPNLFLPLLSRTR